MISGRSRIYGFFIPPLFFSGGLSVSFGKMGFFAVYIGDGALFKKSVPIVRGDFPPVDIYLLLRLGGVSILGVGI